MNRERLARRTRRAQRIAEKWHFARIVNTVTRDFMKSFCATMPETQALLGDYSTWPGVRLVFQERELSTEDLRAKINSGEWSLCR